MELSSNFLQILVITLVIALSTNAQQFYIPNIDSSIVENSEYQPVMTRQERNSIRNAIPRAAVRNGPRIAWNMFIRPGMAGGFKKRCQNGGVAKPSNSNNPEHLSLECECTSGFTGQFCETKISEETSFDSVFKISLCIFFLLILPMIILYFVRACYLALKRSGALEVVPKQKYTVRLLPPSSPRPRPAFRTVSLPVATAIILTDDNNVVLSNVRGVHRTFSWQPATTVILNEIAEEGPEETEHPRSNGSPSRGPPPPPPYTANFEKTRL